VIDLPRDIKDVLVADPKIANAVVRSAQRAYIIGASVGQTNIVFFDAAGQQIAAYDIAVKRDLNGAAGGAEADACPPTSRSRASATACVLTGSRGEPDRSAAGRRSSLRRWSAAPTRS
jgi:pilus assembly protein CpaC